MGRLTNKTIAVLSENGFEEVELTEPVKRLKEEGAEVHIVSPQHETIKGWNTDHWSIEVNVDVHIENASESDYDGLMLPGGVMNPDKLRTNSYAIDFVRAFFEAGKPVAAICHGPQILINADVVSGREVTSYPSIRQDLENAGANWTDQEVVVDQGLVTSRNPDDIPAFNDKMVEEFAEGVHVD